jgi:hypothetical protein
MYSVPKLLAKHVRPFFGHMALEEIRTGNVNDWIGEMRSKKLEPKTIHNIWQMELLCWTQWAHWTQLRQNLISCSLRQLRIVSV